MKAESTIRGQINRLRKLAESQDAPSHVAADAYAAYHALRWVIEKVSWTPARLLEREAARKDQYRPVKLER